ncbi:MAG: glucoamylase family protein [Candidatus Omnitrophica bacterium]|nr:glucoamylase family protein [Candidatus Omnitrophota bacterium]
MKIKIYRIALIITLISLLNISAFSLDVQDAVKILKRFQDQQLNYCYQNYFRLSGLYKSSPYVNEVDIATSGFALAGLVVAAEKGLLSQENAKSMFIETVDACLRLQSESKNNYQGFLYHFYVPDYSGSTLKPKSGVEVSTIDTAILLAGILTASEYFSRQGYYECRDKAREFYSNINWRHFFNGGRKQFHMAWNNVFFGFWDYYTDEIFLIAILAQGSPIVEHRVDIRDSFGNIAVKQGSYKGHSYVYSWYGSLFTYLFAHAFIDFRRLDKDLIHSVDWWQNTKSAVLADIRWCQDNGYPEDIFGISACWSKSSVSGSVVMEYRDRVGSALSGCGPAERFYNNKNGIKPVAPYAALGSLPFFDDRPILENPAFRMFYKVRNKAVDRSGLLIESLDAGCLDEGGVPVVNSDWLVGMDIIFPAIMIENYFSDLIWDNFMRSSSVQFALLKAFPAYFTYLVKK